MRIELRCKSCSHAWEVRDEPRALLHLSCPQCEQSADARASEDLASALEDVLAQLYRLSEAAELRISLDTEAIPAPFRPPQS
ncbi:MAG TPA: hypothetical protein VFH51_17300 [Myxococcota bacterium]|nr:hypothetical protein [Myxococcota bacterium]